MPVRVGPGTDPRDPVLVVDDESIVLHSIQLILRHSGYETVAAASGSEALRMLESAEPFCVAIIDLVLPDIPGEEVLRRARAARPGLPLIAMSGYGDRLSKAKDRLPADATISKPFDRESLVHTVEALVTAAKGSSTPG